MTMYAILPPAPSEPWLIGEIANHHHVSFPHKGWTRPKLDKSGEREACSGLVHLYAV